MKYLFTILLLSSIPCFTNSSSPNYNLTTYYYNSSSCNKEPFTSFSIVDSTCGNNSDINKCRMENLTRYSYFQTCHPIKNTKIVKKSKNSTICSLRILLTIFILTLMFIVYKWCLQGYLDNLCLDIKYKCETGCQRDSVEEYSYL